MNRLFGLVCGLIALVGASAVQAQPAFPERGTAPVVDAANVIDDAAEAELTAKLTAFEQANQRQFVVATVPDLGGYDISDYGYQLGRHWGLGDKATNQGIILLVAPKEHKVRIEVGYGLEAILPDGLAYDIIEGQIVPRFKAGDMTGGIVAGADAVMHQLTLPPEEAAKVAAQAKTRKASGGGVPIGLLVWMGFLFFFFILPLMRRGSRGQRHGSGIGNVILWSAINSALNSGRSGGSDWGGGGGSDWGGGGGFSGGGGSFGGGGASGSW